MLPICCWDICFNNRIVNLDIMTMSLIRADNPSIPPGLTQFYDRQAQVTISDVWLVILFRPFSLLIPKYLLECLAFHSFGSSSYGLDWNSTFLVCCCVDFFFVLFYVCTAVVFSLNVVEIPLKMALNSNQSINYIGIGPLLQSLFRFQYSLFCTNHLMKQ